MYVCVCKGGGGQGGRVVRGQRGKEAKGGQLSREGGPREEK